MRSRPIRERFWEKVKKTDDCWLWIAGVNTSGYGTIGQRKPRKTRLATHVLWELLGRPRRQEECLLHTCDNRRCVKPDHLYVGTHQQNMADRDARGRTAKGQNKKASKLSPVAVMAMRQERICSSITYKELGQKYGVCGEVARRAINGQTWRHVRGL